MPVLIINGGADRLGNVRFSELQKLRDLDLGLGRTSYRHASVIDLYVHTKFSLKSDKLFVDGRTDVPNDGRTFPPLILLGRLRGVDLKIIK